VLLAIVAVTDASVAASATTTVHAAETMSALKIIAANVRGKISGNLRKA
jgi:hypothetical protein